MQGRLLILDAVPTNRIVLNAMLEPACYDIAQGESILSAMKVMRKSRPDLVLTAWSMPDGTAIDLREGLDLDAWRAEQVRRNAAFADRLKGLAGVSAETIPDPAGMPFDRVHLRIDDTEARMTARDLATALLSGTPPVHVMDHRLDAGEIVLEMVQLREDETAFIADRLRVLLA